MKVEPDAAGMDGGLLERITDHFRSNYVDAGKIAGCQITVVRGGHVAYHRTLGLMDREQGIPMAEDTIFRIFSMTKPIASVALMQLYERGMFQLLDPVHRYIPEWRTLQVGVVREDGTVELVKPERPMNMRDVLMHMTGLPGALFPGNPIDATFKEARDALGPGQTLESVTALLAEHPLKFHPGTQWNYGISTDIVGRLVEILSGRSLDQYLRAELFEPLGMADTGFWVPESELPRLAALYQYRPANTPRLLEGPFATRVTAPHAYLSGAGGLVSTTKDYVAFCQMLANGGRSMGAAFSAARRSSSCARITCPMGQPWPTWPWADSAKQTSRAWASGWGSPSAWVRWPLRWPAPPGSTTGAGRRAPRSGSTPWRICSASS